MIDKITAKQLPSFIASGEILAKSMATVIDSVKPGISTEALDQIAETEIRRLGGKPSFKFYSTDGEHPFPGSLCVSINSEVVHGCPSKKKIIKNGDLVGLDLGCFYNDFYTDTAVTVGVGRILPIEKKLIDVTKKSLALGISAARPGKRIGDIGYAIQSFVEKNGFSVVKDLVGHGVGKKVHQDPSIPNFGQKNTGLTIEPNIALAIEPMVNIGSGAVYVDCDDWTIITRDGKKSAHFEQTIIVLPERNLIITPFINV